MFHVKHLTVRQGRQVGQYSGETGAAVVRYSGGTGEVRRSGGVRWYQVAQVRSGGSGAPHSGRCALIVLARPYAKSVPYCLNFC